MIIDNKCIVNRNICPLCNSFNNRELFKKLCQHTNELGCIVRCLDCNFVYTSNILNDEGINLFYKIKYIQSNYKYYSKFEDLKKINFEYKINFISKFKQADGNNYLDIGCGEGISISVANKLSFNTYGIEVNNNSAKKANYLATGEVHCCSLDKIKNLPLPKVDIITFFDSLEHLNFPRKAINDVSPFLNSGGVIFAEVFNYNSFLRFLMGRHYTHIIPFEHPSYFTKNTLKKLFELCDYKVLFCDTNYRLINLNFLEMSLKEFNPILGHLVKSFNRFIPSRMKDYYFNFPIGAISVVAMKR